MPNNHLNGLKSSFYEGHKSGERLGQQRMMDCTMIYLHRQGWGEKRIKDYFDGVNAVCDEFSEAFRPTQEQEIYQERMDAELATVIHDCLAFAERYPEIKVLGYDKPVREQKHQALKRRKGKR